MSDTTLFESFLSEAGAPETAPAAPFTIPCPGKVTHKLTLRRGRGKNFRSVGNEFLEVDYQRNSATLITSDDNGAGKSTMLVWLPIFVLFNDTYSKREKKAGLVNSVSRKDCVGEIEFFTKGSEWKVRRGIKPDFVEVHQQVDGKWKQIENDAAKSDTNKYILELLGVDQKMFENSLVLGKEKYIPFSEMMTADRRLMVETIWDLGFFTVMNEDVKQAIKRITGQLSETDRLRALADNSLNGERLRLEQIEASNEQLKQHSQDSLESAIVLESDMVQTLETETQNYETTKEKLDKLVDEKNEILSKVLADGDQEILELCATYDSPILEAEQRGEKVVSDIRAKVDAKKEAKEGILSRKSDLLSQRSVVLDKQKMSSEKLNENIASHIKGQNFRIRFETELSTHQQAIKRFHDMGECPTCTQVVSDETKGRITDEYQPKIDDINNKMGQLDERIQNLNSEIAKYEAEVAALKEEMVPVEQALSDVEFEIRTFESELAQLVKDYDQGVKQARQAVDTLQMAREERCGDLRREVVRRADNAAEAITQQINDLSESLDQVYGRKKAASNRLTSHRAYIEDLRKKLLVEPTPTDTIRGNIANLEAELEELQNTQIELDNSRQDHEHLLYLLRDDQTKARIVALYLPFLNSKVNEYLEALNMFLQIQIDDKFEINMASPERKGQSIFSLSTGQRARLNIAIMLALRDVANLKASIQCNILVLDEILENMSERGVQESVMMLNNKFRGNNLFVISQREQEFQEYFEHNIRYGLRNGMTTVIDKN